jgi:futalosine hydrolase
MVNLSFSLLSNHLISYTYFYISRGFETLNSGRNYFMLIITPSEREKEPLSGFIPHHKIYVCGIGRVNTASFITEEVIIRRPDRVLLVGCAGACQGSGLCIGDIAVAQSEFSADEGLADKTGIRTMQEIGIPVIEKGDNKYFNLFPVDQVLADRIYESARSEGLTAQKGRFATVSAASGTVERARMVNKRINALCENMEGAAAAHVCLKYAIPFAEIRGISNVAGQRRPFDIVSAMSAAAKVLRRFLADDR